MPGRALAQLDDRQQRERRPPPPLALVAARRSRAAAARRRFSAAMRRSKPSRGHLVHAERRVQLAQQVVGRQVAVLELLAVRPDLGVDERGAPRRAPSAALRAIRTFAGSYVTMSPGHLAQRPGARPAAACSRSGFSRVPARSMHWPYGARDCIGKERDGSRWHLRGAHIADRRRAPAVTCCLRLRRDSTGPRRPLDAGRPRRGRGRRLLHLGRRGLDHDARLWDHDRPWPSTAATLHLVATDADEVRLTLEPIEPGAVVGDPAPELPDLAAGRARRARRGAALARDPTPSHAAGRADRAAPASGQRSRSPGSSSRRTDAAVPETRARQMDRCTARAVRRAPPGADGPRPSIRPVAEDPLTPVCRAISALAPCRV